MFGIVSTGDKWVLTKAVFNADDKPALSVTKDLTLPIDGNEMSEVVVL
jgi:hypothetical protein